MKSWHLSIVAFHIFLGSALCIFFLTSCGLDYSDPNSALLDPNSAFNAAGDAIDKVADTIGAVGAIGVAIGGPIGSVLLLGSTLFSTGWGTWQKKRKALVESKMSSLSKTTSAIVAVVDSLSSIPVGPDGKNMSTVIKSEVKKRLVENKILNEGKAIISEIKAGIEDAKAE